MTNEPKPAECWGLYDAIGRLMQTAHSRDAYSELIETIERNGWTIRRVRVEPIDNELHRGDELTPGQGPHGDPE